MTDKRLFPGISKKEAERKRTEREQREKREAEKQRAEKMKMALEEARHKLKTETQAVKSKIVRETKLDEKIQSGKYVTRRVLTGSLALGIITAMVGIMRSYKTYVVSDYGKSKYDGMGLYKDEYLINAWEPTKFDNVMFGISLGCLGLLMLSVCTLVGLNKTKKKAEQSKDGLIELMLYIKENNPEISIDEKQLEKLLKRVPDVVSRMSEAERVYFDILMKGNLKIASDRTFRNMAIAIMEGHLASHPEDLRLILDVFDRDSIPQQFIDKSKER